MKRIDEKEVNEEELEKMYKKLYDVANIYEKYGPEETFCLIELLKK